jgi:predicted DNA-binding transcriptional regulator AlpA
MGTTPTQTPVQSGANQETGGVSALLPVAEVAARLGIAEATLETWRSRGCGPPRYKIGGKIVRYKLEDLETWINTSRRQGHEPTTTQQKLASPVLHGRPNLDSGHRIGRHKTQPQRRTAGGGGSAGG